MNVIDLFCGCGGFSKGFEQAGFDVRLGIDIWQDAVTTYKAKFPSAATIVGDISTLTGDDLLAAAGMSANEVDVIIGGPPCQGFSLSGVIRQIKFCLIPQIKNNFLRHAEALRSVLFAAISAYCFM